MRNAYKTITLYNYYLDPKTGYDASRRVLIEGVSAFVQTQVNVDKEGLASASVYTIRIPEKSARAFYVTPKEFNSILESSTGDPPKINVKILDKNNLQVLSSDNFLLISDAIVPYFTLAKGDKIVLGVAEEETATPAYLESTYGNDQVMTITGVTDNRDKREPHWKVVGE